MFPDLTPPVVDAQRGPHSCQTAGAAACSFYKPLQTRIPFIRQCLTPACVPLLDTFLSLQQCNNLTGYGAIDTQDRNARHKGMSHSGCSSFSSVFSEGALILTFKLSVALLILEISHTTGLRLWSKGALQVTRPLMSQGLPDQDSEVPH